MTIKLLDSVVLARDLPERGLFSGDLGAVVEVYGPDSFEVEFVQVSGRAQALVELTSADLREVHADDVVAVRTVRRAS